MTASKRSKLKESKLFKTPRKLTALTRTVPAQIGRKKKAVLKDQPLIRGFVDFLWIEVQSSSQMESSKSQVLRSGGGVKVDFPG